MHARSSVAACPSRLRPAGYAPHDEERWRVPRLCFRLRFAFIRERRSSLPSYLPASRLRKTRRAEITATNKNRPAKPAHREPPCVRLSPSGVRQLDRACDMQSRNFSTFHKITIRKKSTEALKSGPKHISSGSHPADQDSFPLKQRRWCDCRFQGRRCKRRHPRELHPWSLSLVYKGVPRPLRRSQNRFCCPDRAPLEAASRNVSQSD